MFGTLLVAMVVKHKWLSFGHRRFMLDAFRYVLSLAMIVMTSLLVTECDYSSDKFDSDSGLTVCGMMAVLGVCSALEMWDEARSSTTAVQGVLRSTFAR